MAHENRGHVIALRCGADVLDGERDGTLGVPGQVQQDDLPPGLARDGVEHPPRQREDVQLEGPGVYLPVGPRFPGSTVLRWW
jgi:hypothetical protein